MNSPTIRSVQEIIKWLKEELEEYSKLLSIMEKQKLFALEEDEGRLLQVIHEKERVLGNLYKIDRKIQLSVKVLDQVRHDELVNLSQIIRGEIESKLGQVLALETFCENLLEKKKSGLRAQMKTTKHGRSVLKGYGSTSLKRSRFSKNV